MTAKQNFYVKSLTVCGFCNNYKTSDDGAMIVLYTCVWGTMLPYKDSFDLMLFESILVWFGEADDMTYLAVITMIE